VNLRLDGRYALVTGGTRGVGRAVSLALARACAGVLAVYRSDDAAASRLTGEPGWDPARCHVVRADLGTAEGREHTIALVREHFGGLDVLVNNLGTYRPAPLATVTEAEVVEALHANLGTHVLVTRSALPVLRDGAAVVNIGAGMAERGRANHVLFTSAKAGLVGLTRSLDRELIERSIRVNTVAPGVVQTERGIDLPARVRAGILAAIPLRRFATAADVASLVLFLASDLAGAVAGVTIRVDGGI
jgi:NAD(P)-dependent dehydrogenase (short-subunit alcohol dehydrogenase family)